MQKRSTRKALFSVGICLWPMLLAASARPLKAQLVVKLSPQTLAEFDRYAAGVEAQLNERWQGKRNFLPIEDDPAIEARVLNGEVYVRQMNDGRPAPVTEGLVHDWQGAVFIPKTTVEQAVSVLENFDDHEKIYPAVSQSRTLERKDHEVTGYWRLQQKGVVPVILDVEQTVRYSRIAPDRWKGEAYAKKIVELDTGLFGHGKKFPLGEGHGYLWRLYGFWSLESSHGGVLAECRTLSLSRDIPQGLAWAVGPYVQKMPQESLTSTLKATRGALTHEK